MFDKNPERTHLPLMKITDLHTTLQVLLSECARERGITSGWQRRKGKLSASQFVQIVVFGFLEDPHATMGHLNRVAQAVGAHVRQQSLTQRFSAASGDLMRGVLQDAMGILVETDPVDMEVFCAFPGGVYLGDSTQIALHDDWQSIWDGGGIAAALKIPALIDVLKGSLHLDLTPARQNDSATTLANSHFPKHSVVIEDLGYLNIERMESRREQNVDTVIPMRVLTGDDR